jgi:hypothetical protein
MNLRRMPTELSLLLGLLIAGGSVAQEKLGKPPKGADKQVVDSRAKKRAPATAINFRKELSLPFPSLSTLGARIEAARRAADPVGLANAASELAVAEQVSGKKAPLTSAALLKEAAQLAGLRRQAAELKATLRIANQMATEQEVVTDLQEEIAMADQSARAEQAAIQQNEQPTAAPRWVLVNNYTPQYIDVYVNGFYQMQLTPGASRWCLVDHRWNPTVLTAYGDEDVAQWGPRYIWGEFKTYTWNLN